MSGNSENSLLGFLQKKSLFSNSPNRASRKRSRSKSRDSRNFDKGSNINYLQESSRVEQAQRPLYQEQRTEPRLFNTFQQEPYRSFQQPHPQIQARTIESPPRSQQQRDERSQAGLWTGMMQSANSFQSARLESSQCLDSLGGKLRKEISSVNYRIQAFNSKMGKVLNSEFKSVRQRILKVFQDAFKESEKYIKEYMTRKQQQLTAQLVQMRQYLQKQAARVEEMKEELNKPTWRKVAGEILSTDFEKKVEEMLKKSEALQAGHWQLGDISGYRIKNIQNELRQIIRLKT